MIELQSIRAMRTTRQENYAIYIFLQYEIPDPRENGTGTRPWRARIPVSALSSDKLRSKSLDRVNASFRTFAGRDLTRQEREQIVQDFLLNAEDALKKLGGGAALSRGAK